MKQDDRTKFPLVFRYQLPYLDQLGFLDFYSSVKLILKFILLIYLLPGQSPLDLSRTKQDERSLILAYSNID